jgi:hypothetical protein
VKIVKTSPPRKQGLFALAGAAGWLSGGLLEMSGR